MPPRVGRRRDIPTYMPPRVCRVVYIPPYIPPQVPFVGVPRLPCTPVDHVPAVSTHTCTARGVKCALLASLLRGKGLLLSLPEKRRNLRKREKRRVFKPVSKGF